MAVADGRDSRHRPPLRVPERRDRGPLRPALGVENRQQRSEQDERRGPGDVDRRLVVAWSCRPVLQQPDNIGHTPVMVNLDAIRTGINAALVGAGV